MTSTKLLLEKKLFLLDMDGTIYLENVLFPKCIDLLKHIKTIGGKYIFLTNNSSKSVSDYIDKLRSMLIDVDKSNFTTSSQATALFLRDNYRDKSIYVLGTESLKKEFIESNLNVCDVYNDNIDCLVVGYDTELNYTKLVDASRILYNGADFIATNPDTVCPTSFGNIPDCGSICYMLEIATGKKPEYIGKPKGTMVELAIIESEYTSDETIVIGDRLYTDIASGINAGVSTGLVLSGETKYCDLEHSEFKPDFVFRDIAELYDIISKN